MSPNLSKVISEKELHKRIKEMGETLTDKFKNSSVLAVCVLKGSFIFFADLIRLIECDMNCEFLSTSSYGNNSHSSGEVKVTMDINSSVQGRHVLLVEDIIDTGLTMSYLQKMFEIRKPKSITTVTLLHKPEAKKVECKIDLVGFKIPNDFVVGYGLDYQNQYRHLPYIARLENLN